MVTNRRFEAMGKRRFMKTLAGLGVSVATLRYGTKEGLAKATGDPDEKVPYVKYLSHAEGWDPDQNRPPDREPIYDTIPRDLWLRVEAAHTGADQVRNRLSNALGDTKNITVGVVSRDGDQYRKEINVRYRTLETIEGHAVTPTPEFADVEKRVPSNVPVEVAYDGKAVEFEVPTRIEEQTVYEQGTCDSGFYDDNHEDEIPGGTRVGVNGLGGTIGTPAKDSDGKSVMVSAGHVYDNGDVQYQPGENYEPADIKDTWYSTWDNNDSGYGFPANGANFNWNLAGDGSNFKDGWIAGVTTWDAIKNHEGDTDWIVNKQGNRTGDQSGHITEAVNNDIDDREAREVWIGADSGTGDSGGPYYREIEDRDPTQYYITGIHAWGSSDDCPNNPSGGNTMEYVEEFWDLTV